VCVCVGKKKRKTSKSTTNDDNDDDVLTNSNNNNNINVDDNKLSGEGGGRKLHNGHSRGEVENTEEQDVVPDLPNYDSTYGRVRRLSRGSISTGTVNTTTIVLLLLLLLLIIIIIRLSVLIQRFNAILLNDSFESADHLG